MHRLQDLMYPLKFAVSSPFNFLYYFVNLYSYAMSCTPCTKAKAAYKPFDMDKAYAKARVEVVRATGVEDSRRFLS